MKFTYQAFDRSGKNTSGSVDAASEAEAREQLRRQGLFVSVIQSGSTPADAPKAKGGGKAMSAGKRLKNLAMFARQLHVLLASGTPIVQAIQSIEKQIRQADWQRVVTKLREHVEQGSPLSEAMGQHPDIFDNVCVSLVSAGETSGNMGQMLDRLATLLRKQLMLRNAIIGALIYPALLIAIGFCVLISMLLFVLPRFTVLFESLDAPLPPTTKILLWASDVLWAAWWAILPGTVVLGFVAAWWLKSPGGKRVIHSAVLYLPRVGLFARSLLTAKTARMLGVLLDSKVALLDALALTRQGAVNYHYADLVARAEEAVGRGEPVSAVMATSDLISPCVQEAFRTGEQSGQLGTPLVQMADFLDEENDNVIKTLTRIIEPVILIILGVIVGFIAMSMFLPLFDIVSAAQGGG